METQTRREESEEKKQKPSLCLQWQTAVLSLLKLFWTEHWGKTLLHYWWAFRYFQRKHMKTQFQWSQTHFYISGIKCSQFLSRTRFGLWCLWFWKIINGAFSSFQESWSLQIDYLSYLHNLLIFSAALWGHVSLFKGSIGCFCQKVQDWKPVN